MINWRFARAAQNNMSADSICISALVATYNRRELFARTLPSILSQKFPRDQYEVVIVVDGSTDGTAQWLCTIRTDRQLKIIEQPNRGLPAARNAALGAARGEVVLLLDDDIMCSPQLLLEHLKLHRDADNIVAYGPLSVSDDSPPSIAVNWLRIATQQSNSRRMINSQPEWPADLAVAANYSIRRSALLAAGGFDERLVGACEEFELGWRLRKAGFDFRFAPNAASSQIYVKSAQDIVNDGGIRGRNEVRLCRKHRDYRSISPLKRIADGRTPIRVARIAGARLPISPEPLLACLYRIADRFTRFPTAHRIAMRLLGLRLGAAFLRAAVREAGSWGAFRQQFNMTLPVLLYHKIGLPRAQRNAFITVPMRNFERQMRWLTDHGYIAIGTADWLAWRDEGKSLPKKPVMITFDDAYAETATNAFPVIRECGLKATVYIVTGQVGGINAWDVADGLPLERLMSADQIWHWAQRGIEFGVHTRTHPDLRTLDAKTLEDELLGGADDLQKLLGARPISFAYPFGYYNDKVSSYVSTVFQTAATCDEGLNQLSTNPSLLRRTMVLPGDSILEFSSRVRFGWNVLDPLRRRIRFPLGRDALRRILGRDSTESIA
jgi:GT2 family glycosyltransferase/peptidoglycan/xylan/chitin deacetylase (PgdA/CDA1 family)